MVGPQFVGIGRAYNCPNNQDESAFGRSAFAVEHENALGKVATKQALAGVLLQQQPIICSTCPRMDFSNLGPVAPGT